METSVVVIIRGAAGIMWVGARGPDEHPAMPRVCPSGVSSA